LIDVVAQLTGRAEANIFGSAIETANEQ